LRVSSTIVGDLKFSQIIRNCLKCLCGFSPNNPWNCGKAFSRPVLSTQCPSGYWRLLFMMGLLDVANYRMVLSSIMFGSGSEDVFVNKEDESGIVFVVASNVEGVPSITHPNSSLLRALRKFHSSFGSN